MHPQVTKNIANIISLLHILPLPSYQWTTASIPGHLVRLLLWWFIWTHPHYESRVSERYCPHQASLAMWGQLTYIPAEWSNDFLWLYSKDIFFQCFYILSIKQWPKNVKSIQNLQARSLNFFISNDWIISHLGNFSFFHVLARRPLIFFFFLHKSPAAGNCLNF